MKRTVYISSSTEASHLDAVVEALQVLKLKPIMLDSQQLHGQNPVDVSRDLMLQSGSFVHILGKKIGIIPNTTLDGEANSKRLTIHELELAFALRHQLRVYYFWSPEAGSSAQATLPQSISRFSYALFQNGKGIGFQNDTELFTKMLVQLVQDILPDDEEISSKPHFGIPLDDPQFYCDIFVVMPFRNSPRQNYEQVILPVTKELGLTLKRGDDFHSMQGQVMTEVWSAIYHCRLVIVDCTNVEDAVNGNIYYELGIADTLGKPVLLLTQTPPESMPFDVRHRRFIHYDLLPSRIALHQSHLKQGILRLLGEPDPKQTR